MRILYLVYAQQKTFASFEKDPKTGFSWVDALLNELSKNQSLNIALAVPINERTLQKKNENGIRLYGLPNQPERNRIKRYYKRILYTIENKNINLYVEQVISDFKPDVIQIFGSENPFGLIVNLDYNNVIIHIQGYLFVCLKKWFSGISSWKLFRYTSFRNLLHFFGTYHTFFTFRKRSEREAQILMNCKYFLGRTEFDKRITHLYAPDAKYYHCNELLRPEFFTKSWSMELTRNIGCVSILNGSVYKGIELLIETSKLLEEYSSFSFSFNVCGISEDEELVRILKKIYRIEFGGINIKFLGKLTAEDLVSELQSANLFIHPSHAENSPNSICEAMALGMPIISTNVGGIPSIIKDKSEGLLIQEGEPYSLAAAILELINNYDMAKYYGNNAREKAFKRHNPKAVVNTLINVYEDVIRTND
ncbi:glycosyltransferase family 4 protein [Bacteroidota bacterium]